MNGDWTSIKDALPDDDRFVLTVARWARTRVYATLRYKKEIKEWVGVLPGPSRVTHWTELPPMPETVKRKRTGK